MRHDTDRGLHLPGCASETPGKMEGQIKEKRRSLIRKSSMLDLRLIMSSGYFNIAKCERCSSGCVTPYNERLCLTDTGRRGNPGQRGKKKRHRHSSTRTNTRDEEEDLCFDNVLFIHLAGGKYPFARTRLYARTCPFCGDQHRERSLHSSLFAATPHPLHSGVSMSVGHTQGAAYSEN